MKRLLNALIFRPLSTFIVEVLFGGFWKFRNSLRGGVLVNLIYKGYMDQHHFFIGKDAHFEEIPVLPHDVHGIHISSQAIIGKNVVIFQQVTIGSNTLAGHKRYGSPTIGDNVYIGAGAKIIGKVTIGNNCRIGANAVVVKDMPENTTAIAAQTRFIFHKGKALENVFKSI